MLSTVRLSMTGLTGQSHREPELAASVDADPIVAARHGVRMPDETMDLVVIGCTGVSAPQVVADRQTGD